MGIHGTNDTVENKFATGDFTFRTYRGISVLNASGIVQQRTAHDYDRPMLVVSDRRKRKEVGDVVPQKAGFFWRVLDVPFRDSLLRTARFELPRALKVGRAERRAHDEEKLQRREEAINRQVAAHVTAVHVTAHVTARVRDRPRT